MDSKKNGGYRAVLGVIILICLCLLFFQNANAITGNATSSTTTSNVTIQKYLSVSMCTNLASGITFGDVSQLPVTDLNGSHNYDGASSGTTYCINVSNDGNTPIDFCIGALVGLTSVAADVIGLGNETYSNSTTTNAANPLLASQTALTTSYVKSGNSIAVGTPNYYRFWLDIPAAQPSGDYNNTVYFKGVTTGLACGALS